MNIVFNKIIKSKLITDTKFLLFLFLITLLITFLFPILTYLLNIVFIDTISSPDKVRKIILGMTLEQRFLHSWITGTIDVLYPLSYGLFFTGMAIKFPIKSHFYHVIPGLIVIPFDIFENIIQILVLTDTADFLLLKSYITPCKFTLFFLGLFISIISLIKWFLLRKKEVLILKFHQIY